MNILDKIIQNKRREVDLKSSILPISQLEKSVLFEKKTNSLSKALQTSKTGIIAEHKRRSPSKGDINFSLSIDKVVKEYQEAGASGISVLTDTKYFGGSLDDLLLAKASVNIPLLRKEFILNEYQIIEAKAYGADAILLIAAILTPNEIKKLSNLAQSIDLEILLEVHNLSELEASLMPSVNLIGVNNRNLKTFEVNTEISEILAPAIPNEFIKVSESGLSNVQSILNLKKHGYQGFLIGETFMRSDNPGKSAREFIKKITA